MNLTIGYTITVLYAMEVITFLNSSSLGDFLAIAENPPLVINFGVTYHITCHRDLLELLKHKSFFSTIHTTSKHTHALMDKRKVIIPLPSNNSTTTNDVLFLLSKK